MGTGPLGHQLPRTQRSVNSSAQTNSQSSGVAGQAGEPVCAHLCVERMKKKGGGGGGRGVAAEGQEASETIQTEKLIQQPLQTPFPAISIIHQYLTRPAEPGRNCKLCDAREDWGQGCGPLKSPQSLPHGKLYEEVLHANKSEKNIWFYEISWQLSSIILLKAFFFLNNNLITLELTKQAWSLRRQPVFSVSMFPQNRSRSTEDSFFIIT